MSDEQRVYWAAEPESKKCVERFFKVRHRHLQQMTDTGRFDRIVRSFNAYRGFGPDGYGDTSQTSSAGDHGELVDVTTNDYAQLVQQGHIQLTQSPPAFKSVAANTDYRSRTNAELADVLCEYYENEGEMSEAENDCARGALKSAEGWVVSGWDRRRGKEIAADEKGVVYEGDAYFVHKAPWDMTYDLDAGAPKNTKWICFRSPYNLHDLAATHPERAEALLSGKTTHEGESLEFPWRKTMRPDTDYVWVWELRHVPSPAVPNGRLLRFVNGDCVLFDSIKAPGSAYEHLALYPKAKADAYSNAAPEAAAGLADFGYPYGDQLEANSLTPERIEGDLEPHTSYFDLLSLQEGVNTSISAMASTVNVGGVVNYQTNKGANVTPHDFAGGFRILETESPITLMESPEIDPGAVQFGEACVTFMRRRVGFNDAALGDVTKGMPAQAMALLRAEAVQFHSNLQRAFYKLQAAVRSSLIRLLRNFANTKRVAAIAGKSRTYQLKEFEAANLEGVERVNFEPMAPAMRTQAGRVAIADTLMEKGAITNREYLTLYTTGRADALWESETATNDSIQREKELLRDGVGLAPIQMQTLPDGSPALDQSGRPMPKVDQTGAPLPGAGTPGTQYVRPLETDPHWLYIVKDLDVLAMPDARQNPKVVTAVLDVVRYRESLMLSMRSSTAMLLNAPNWLVQQLQMQEGAAAGMPPGPPGPPGASGKPDAGGPPGSPPDSPAAHQGGQVAPPPGGPDVRDVKMPKPPRNPLTGDQPQPNGVV